MQIYSLHLYAIPHYFLKSNIYALHGNIANEIRESNTGERWDEEHLLEPFGDDLSQHASAAPLGVHDSEGNSPGYGVLVCTQGGYELMHLADGMMSPSLHVRLLAPKLGSASCAVKGKIYHFAQGQVGQNSRSPATCVGFIVVQRGCIPI